MLIGIVPRVGAVDSQSAKSVYPLTIANKENRLVNYN